MLQGLAAGAPILAAFPTCRGGAIMPAMSRRRLALASCAPLLASCAMAPAAQVEGAVRFVEAHYRKIRVGADWAGLQSDFAPRAVIAVVEPGAPGLPKEEGVAAYFAEAGPRVDALRSFRIEPLGVQALVYDRIATVWAHSLIEAEAQDGARSVSEAVDVFCLALDEEDRWRITYLLWQGAAAGWDPPLDRSGRTFTRGGLDVRLGLAVHSP